MENLPGVPRVFPHYLGSRECVICTFQAGHLDAGAVPRSRSPHAANQPYGPLQDPRLGAYCARQGALPSNADSRIPPKRSVLRHAAPVFLPVTIILVEDRPGTCGVIPPQPLDPSAAGNLDRLLAMTATEDAVPLRVEVKVKTQQLEVIGRDGVLARYAVSTAAKGAGCVRGSYCTPLGLHRIKLKIGLGCPVGAVFFRRRATGEVFGESLRAQCPDRDWILSRILWLDGMEPGRNRGGEVDTLRRFIYIHGTADEEDIGKPRSKGCIRMRNVDVIELFDLVPHGLPVRITL